MKEKYKHPVFLKSLFGAATILAFGIYLFTRGIKEKDDFNKITGQIVYYSDNYLDFKQNHDYPNKYLQINNYPRVFEIGLPADTSNKSYIFKYKQIMLGDAIDIYFDENTFENDQRVNREMRYIDKNRETIFLNEPNDKTAGLCFTGVGFLISAGLIILKLSGRII